MWLKPLLRDKKGLGMLLTSMGHPAKKGVLGEPLKRRKIADFIKLKDQQTWFVPSKVLFFELSEKLVPKAEGSSGKTGHGVEESGIALQLLTERIERA